MTAVQTERRMAPPTPYELTISALTLRTAGFTERVRAAALAGFTGVGLSAEQYLRARAEGLTDRDLAAVLADHDVRLTELELLKHWALPERCGAEERAADDALLRLAGELGVPRINAGLFTHHTLPDLVAGFGAVCRRALDAGATVGLEFMPFSGIPDLGRARRIVEEAAQPNSGLILDTWHIARAHTPQGLIDGLPGELVVGVQLNDAGPEPFADLREEGRHHRLLPGEGRIDLALLLRLLRGRGVDAPVSVEVISDELDSRDPADTADRAFRSTCRVLELAAKEQP